jgi:hypothetical protein
MHLGWTLPLKGGADTTHHYMPPHHLVLHGVILGMTGSGKTGKVLVLVEEALRSRVPVLMIDVKGDLPNLLLAVPSHDPQIILPYVSAMIRPGDKRSELEVAQDIMNQRRDALAEWHIGENELRDFRDNAAIRVITPGSTAGEPLHVFSSLERRSSRWDTDLEAARAGLSAQLSLLLRLLGRESDPAQSREHILLSVFAERRLRANQPMDLGALLADVNTPPVETIGVLAVDEFLNSKKRADLAAALNGLIASPTFENWRIGASLDPGAWLTPGADGRTPAVIVSVAHLDDEERSLVLGLVLEEVLSWMRSLPGTQNLRAMLLFDEVFKYLPPHPANPPTKGPLVSLMKQGRAFGLSTVIATQNPMDLDYRALSNAGTWWLGRLQTDADRKRVIEGLAGRDGSDEDRGELHRVVRRLAPRWFVMRDTLAKSGPVLLHPRMAMSVMRGPMTRGELRAALELEQTLRERR